MALIFTHFWGFRKFRGALIFFKNLTEILGSVYLHEFWWGALMFTFFLVDFSKNLHCKTIVLQKFHAARAKFLGSVYFHIVSRSVYFFQFSDFNKILWKFFKLFYWNLRIEKKSKKFNKKNFFERAKKIGVEKTFLV